MARIVVALMMLLPLGIVVAVTVTESKRLRDAVQRFRELERERIPSSEPPGALPGSGATTRSIGMPDGTTAPAREVIEQSYRELRRWPPNRDGRRWRI